MRPKPSPAAAPARRRPANLAVVLPLESRLLMATQTTITATSQEQASTAIPSFLSTDTTYAAASGGGSTLTLSGYFTDPNVPGTLVDMETTDGSILVSLTDAATPNTVKNFLAYVTSGAYDNTVFHRSALDAAGTGVISASNPAGIIQGGGYTVTADGALSTIPTNSPVADEYATEEYGDIQYTLAEAKTSYANSGTSEWYFNTLDNSAGLDTPTTDPNGVTTSYTVFGKILSGFDVVSAIASLPTANVSTGVYDSSTKTYQTTPAPVAGLTQTQINNHALVLANNLVKVTSVTSEPDVTYTVSSTNSSLVDPSIANGVLSLKYGSGQTGTAVVTVTAINNYDHTSATQAFGVTVPPTSSTAVGPVTAADTVTAVATGKDASGNAVSTPTTIAPLSNDTDATAALNVGTLSALTQPAHGTVAVGATGQFTYTPDASGFVGTDTFTYTVTDNAGNAAAATTVTVNVVAAPQVIRIGHGTKLTSLVVAQPNGVTGRITVAGGTADVTLSAGTITTATRGSVETVSGAGATVASVAVTNNGSTKAGVTIGSTGKGSFTLGGLTDTGPMTQVVAPTTDLTGTLAVTGLASLVLGSADNATINVASTTTATVARIGTATNTSLTAGLLTGLTSSKWLVTDGGSHTVTADQIKTLTVPGEFDDNLNVGGAGGYSITTATVGLPGGTWQIVGEIRNATVTKPKSTWGLYDGSLIERLNVSGTLAGTVSAADIDHMTVAGGLDHATVETTDRFNNALTQLNHLTIAGAVTNSTIAAAGNIGTITARSMSASQVYAGVNSTTATADGLPASTNDLSAEATIKSVALSAGKNAFASSEIAAYVIKAAVLGRVTTSNGGTKFGVSAHTLDALSAGLDSGGGLALTHAQAASAATLAAYVSKHKLTLNDFNITIY